MDALLEYTDVASNISGDHSVLLYLINDAYRGCPDSPLGSQEGKPTHVQQEHLWFDADK